MIGHLLKLRNNGTKELILLCVSLKINSKKYQTKSKQTPAKNEREKEK